MGRSSMAAVYFPTACTSLLSEKCQIPETTKPTQGGARRRADGETTWLSGKNQIFSLVKLLVAARITITRLSSRFFRFFLSAAY